MRKSRDTGDLALPDVGTENARRLVSPAVGTPAHAAIGRMIEFRLKDFFRTGPFEATALMHSRLVENDPSVLQACERLLTWSRGEAKKFSSASIKAWSGDWRMFCIYCVSRALRPLPAAPETVCAFIADRDRAGVSPRSIQRQVSSISAAHRAAGADNPCTHAAVGLAIQQLHRERLQPSEQARPFVWKEIAQFLALAPRSLRDYRDRALILVAYDTLARNSELVGLDVHDFRAAKKRWGKATIRNPRNESSGQNHECDLTPLTLRLVRTYQQEAGLTIGPMFRRIRAFGALGERLEADSVSRIFKKIAQQIGLPASDCKQISGLSALAGAAQDLRELGVSIEEIEERGRWRDGRMLKSRIHKMPVSRDGMMRAAQAQGRA